MSKLKKWWEVYRNDNEKRFFSGKDGNKGLARHPSYIWRSVDLLVKESGLDREEVEKIIDRYLKMGLILPNPKNAEQYGYWERCAPEMGNLNALSLSDLDKQKRIDKADNIKKNIKK